MAEETKQNEKTETEDHPLFAVWARDDETDSPLFVIRCPCGETVYTLEKDFFGEPPEVVPGMTMIEYQQAQKKHIKLHGMQKQVQRVALAQHAESYKDCPWIEKMKAEAGVSSIQELPNPFK